MCSWFALGACCAMAADCYPENCCPSTCSFDLVPGFANVLSMSCSDLRLPSCDYLVPEFMAY